MILCFLTSTGRILKQSRYTSIVLLMVGTAYGSTLSVPPNVTVNVPTTYTGGTIGAAGTLTNNSILTNTGVMTNAGGGSLVVNSGTFVNTGTFNNSGGAIFTNSGTLTGAGTFNNAGGGVLTNSSVLSDTIINDGIIQYTNAGDSPNATITNNGTLDFSAVAGAGISIGTLNGSSLGIINGGAGKNLTVGSGVYYGSIGTNTVGTLIKTGSGTFTLNGDNSTFTGDVLVNGGYLNVGDASHPGAILCNTVAGHNVVVNSGGSIGGYGTINNPSHHTTFNTGSTFVTGLSSSVGPFGNAGFIDSSVFTIQSGVTLQVEAATPLTTQQNFRIAHYGSLTGQFASVVPVGLIEIVGINYGIGINPDYITLTARSANTLPDVNANAIGDSLSSTIFNMPRNRAPSDEDSHFRLHQRSTFTAPRRQRKHNYMDSFSYTDVSKSTASPLQTIAGMGPLITEGQESRLWFAPYYIQGKSGAVNSKSTKDYSEGMAFGCEKRSIKSQWTVGLSASAGLGQLHVPVPDVPKTSIDTKTGSLGFYHSKSFLKDGQLRYDAVLNGVVNTHDSKRFGNPVPGAFYKATSKYNSKALSFDFMTSWKFALKSNMSIRPNLGITLDHQILNAHTEQGGGIYNHTYQRRVTRSREVYAGIGFRRKWTKGNYDIKFTSVYERGYEFGDNNTITKLSVASAPSTIYALNALGPGRDAHYFTVYGSALNTKTNFKLIFAYLATLRKHRTSHAFTVKFEWRFGGKKK